MALARKRKTETQFMYEFEQGVSYRPIVIDGVLEFVKI